MDSQSVINEVLARGGKSTTSGWITDSQLFKWLSQAHRWGAGYKKWTFTEGRVSTTYSSSTEEWDFEGYKADSFRIVTVGGKRLQELNFEDYLILREEAPEKDDRVYAEHGGLVYINPKADVSGTLTAYGQFMPANFDETDGTEETVFSEGNDEGNQAVIEEMTGWIYKRDGRKQDAIEQHLLAQKLLDELWDRVKDEGYRKQTHPEREGQFKRFDVLHGGLRDEIIKQDQF